MIKNKISLTLGEIREAYSEILRAYNEIFSIDPATRKDLEETMDGFAENTMDSSAKSDGNLLEMSRTMTKKALPTLKEAADQPGNATTWRRGEPLDGLNQGLRDRIGKSLKLGI